MSREVVVIGGGLHRYGSFPDVSIPELGKEAIQNALKDANMEWKNIEEAYCGTMGRSTLFAGHQVVGHMGRTGVAITNVENASASGSSAFREAYLAIASGSCDIALAFGVDKISIPPYILKEDNPKPNENKPESKKNTSGKKKDTTSPKSIPVIAFAHMAKNHMQQYGTTIDQLAMVSVKSHYNASLNPYAQYQKAVTIEEVHNARMVADPLTVLHCCPFGDGAAAVVLCNKEVAKKYTDKVCPTVAASILRSVLPDGDPTFSLTRHTANLVYEKTGTGPEDLDLIELHDAFTIEEILYLEALGLCPEGEGGKVVEEGVTALNGKHPINSSGGLISMGHPFGPTGVGQITEILWQMRRECGKRQVEKQVNLAMAHMVGAGGVCIIHLFKK
jgi:benzoylsuccinyl-CoA thiolase BbsB subunit